MVWPASRGDWSGRQLDAQFFLKIGLVANITISSGRTPHEYHPVDEETDSKGYPKPRFENLSVALLTGEDRGQGVTLLAPVRRDDTPEYHSGCLESRV